MVTDYGGAPSSAFPKWVATLGWELVAEGETPDFLRHLLPRSQGPLLDGRGCVRPVYGQNEENHEVVVKGGLAGFLLPAGATLENGK